VRGLVASLTVAVSISLWFAGAAMAVPTPSCDVPPGTAAVDQYCDVLPSADGTGEQTGDMPRVPLARVLSERVRERLQEAGTVGRGLLELPALRLQGLPSVGPDGRPLPRLDAAALVGGGTLALPRRSPLRAVNRSAATSVLDRGFGLMVSASTVALFGAAWVRLRRRDLH
jgi:hypothetical protein